MHTIYVDSPVSDELRRKRLYEGQLFVFSPSEQSLALCDWARELIEEAFAPHDPVKAQYEMPVEQFVDIFGPLKPKFIHHDRTKQLLRDLVAHSGCDLEQTYIDVPRLRGVTSDGYLTAGVGFAHHPHRDTWYSAPMAQLNWWLPIFGFESEASMAFHPRYWSEGLLNGSSQFNYYEWNAVGRKNAAKMIGKDTRKQPTPLQEIDIDPQLRVVCPVGGIVLFSAAQLHSTVPNTSGSTRFSIDFRTVHRGDLEAERGPVNVDSQPEGTALRDFLRGSDREPMPAELVAKYDSGQPEDDGVLVFRPEAAAK